jgi:hypothetical protein
LNVGTDNTPVKIEVVILEPCGIVAESRSENRLDRSLYGYNAFPVEDEASPLNKLVPAQLDSAPDLSNVSKNVSLDVEGFLTVSNAWPMSSVVSITNVQA